MDHAEIVEIAKAKSGIELAKHINERFLSFAETAGDPQDVPAKLEIIDGQIVVSFFGYVATATPRIVKIPSGDFSIEYAFFLHEGEAKFQAWLFQLTSNGKIVAPQQSAEPQSICDFNNLYMPKHICARVILGALRSPLFQPLA